MNRVEKISPLFSAQVLRARTLESNLLGLVEIMRNVNIFTACLVAIGEILTPGLVEILNQNLGKQLLWRQFSE